MDLLAYFRMLARYNRTANETLFENVSSLELAEYFKERPGSFGSIHGLLNHLMVGDQIWMERFQGGGCDTPKLNTVLFDDFSVITNRELFDATRLGLEIASAIQKLYPGKLDFSVDRKLIGSEGVLSRLVAGEDPRSIQQSMMEDIAAFVKKRAPYLLYR